MTNEDWASIAKTVGLELLGEPKSETSTEVRWGTHGSFCLNKQTGASIALNLTKVVVLCGYSSTSIKI